MMLLPELDPEGYSDTLYIGQAGARTGRNLAARLKDYATNYYVTGDSELNLTAARNALDEQKKQLDRQMKEKLEKKHKQLFWQAMLISQWMIRWNMQLNTESRRSFSLVEVSRTKRRLIWLINMELPWSLRTSVILDIKIEGVRNEYIDHRIWWA